LNVLKLARLGGLTTSSPHWSSIERNPELIQSRTPYTIPTVRTSAKMVVLLGLPRELLVAACGDFSLEEDINAIAQSNRYLYKILNPYLYRHNAECSGGSALVWAASHGYRDAAQIALATRERCVDVKGQMKRALLAAAAAGQLSMVELLLDHGADAYAIAEGGLHGTALRAALAHGHEPVVRLLLRHGRLHGTAQAFGQEQVVRLLFDLGRFPQTMI
jgi:ankyrin repeat protein